MVEENNRGITQQPRYIASSQEQISRTIAPEGYNAILLAFSEGLVDHIMETSTELKTEIEEGADIKWEIPFERAGIKLYQIHAMTMSYFEVAGYLLTSDYLAQKATEEKTHEIIEWVYENKRRRLDDVEDPTKRREKVYEFIDTVVRESLPLCREVRFRS